MAITACNSNYNLLQLIYFSLNVKKIIHTHEIFLFEFIFRQLKLLIKVMGVKMCFKKGMIWKKLSACIVNVMILKIEAFKSNWNINNVKNEICFWIQEGTAARTENILCNYFDTMVLFE